MSGGCSSGLRSCGISVREQGIIRRRSGWLVHGRREGLPAAFDQCVGSVACGRAAPADTIGGEVVPRRVAIAEGILDFLAPACEPSLEPAATLDDAGRGHAMLLGIAQSGGQRGYDRLGAANGRRRSSLRCARAAHEYKQQATRPESDSSGHGEW
jgi:hypothetical protein